MRKFAVPANVNSPKLLEELAPDEASHSEGSLEVRVFTNNLTDPQIRTIISNHNPAKRPHPMKVPLTELKAALDGWTNGESIAALRPIVKNLIIVVLWMARTALQVRDDID